MIKGQYPLPLPYREAMAADDFMITDSNREAIGWIDQWPQWPAHCLVIYGPAGSGKTHLAQVWLARSKGYAVSVDDIKSQDLGELQHKKIIAIDNADKIAGDKDKEEFLFHLYNRLREDKGFMLLTAASAPAQWDIKLIDLRSRLLSSPAIPITAPDDDLLAALLVKQFRDRQIDIGMDVIDYLLPRITRSPDSIRNIVTLLDRASLAEGRGITIALARRTLDAQQGFLISQSPSNIP